MLRGASRIKQLVAIASGGLLALSLAFAQALPAEAYNVTVIVNGQTMSFDQPPIIQSGRVFVPMRAIFQQLGASVVYSNGQINATGRGRTISLTIGSTQAVIDGQSTTLDVAPFIVGDRTLVPLRFIAQSLGSIVNWNDSNETVTINGEGGRPPVPPPATGVRLVSNWPTGTIYNHTPQIRFQLSRPTRLGLFTVRLDGNDVTSGVQSNGQAFFVNVPFGLSQGNHRVRVFGQTAGGLQFDQSWTFYQGQP